MSRTAEILVDARLLLARGWHPHFPLRVLGPKEPAPVEWGIPVEVLAGERVPCPWGHPDAVAWDLEGAVLRASGLTWPQLGSVDTWAVLSLLDRMVNPGFHMEMEAFARREGLEPWDGIGGLDASRWSREPGRTQAEVLRLVAKAVSQVSRAEAA